MKKVLMAVAMAAILFCAGCALMHPTIAKQAVRLDKNLDSLLPDYRAVLVERFESTKGMPEGEEKAKILDKFSHDLLLLDATLLLSEDMRKSAETVLKEKK